MNAVSFGSTNTTIQPNASSSTRPVTNLSHNPQPDSLGFQIPDTYQSDSLGQQTLSFRDAPGDSNMSRYQYEGTLRQARPSDVYVSNHTDASANLHVSG
jgi:hypothetical protein